MDKKQLYRIFRSSLKNWLEDNAPIRAAALTFFIILPLPTLLLIVVDLFALFLGPAQAINILVQQISAVAGPEVAGLFNELITSTGSPFTSVWTAVVVVGFSIGGAIGAFAVLRDTMDCIWEVHLPRAQPLWKRIRQRIGPFAIVSSLGLIVIVWTSIATGLFSLIRIYSINNTLAEIGVTIAQVLLSFLVAMLLLAIIYKEIPEAKVHWRDVALASFVTGIAFTVANYIFGTYVSTFTVTTVVGAAGSLLIILLWIFVLNQIVLFGAEVSRVYATTIGTHAQQHLPPTIARLIEPLEEAGRRIEEVTKETVETTQKEATPPPTPELEPQKAASTPLVEAEKTESAKLEIDVKFTPPKKKKQPPKD